MEPAVLNRELKLKLSTLPKIIQLVSGGFQDSHYLVLALKSMPILPYTLYLGLERHPNQLPKESLHSVSNIHSEPNGKLVTAQHIQLPGVHYRLILK